MNSLIITLGKFREIRSPQTIFCFQNCQATDMTFYPRQPKMIQSTVSCGKTSMPTSNSLSWLVSSKLEAPQTPSAIFSRHNCLRCSSYGAIPSYEHTLYPIYHKSIGTLKRHFVGLARLHFL